MRYTINLFPQPERTAIDEVVYFAFHYLRYILVITQFVVICVFFYRFKVDQEIVDLKDSLHNKREIIDSTSTLLNEVRIVDNKISSVDELLSEQSYTNEMVDYFFNKKKPFDSFDINNLTITSNSISFGGVSKDIPTIETFYSVLSNDKRFEHVEFGNVVRSSGKYSFSFDLKNYSFKKKNET